MSISLAERNRLRMILRIVVIVALAVAVVSALPKYNVQRIVGGKVTNIERYPFAVVLLSAPNGSTWFTHSCGGTIINNRSILTAAHCFFWSDSPSQWRSRVGSSYASYGGTVFATAQILQHPNFVWWSGDNDFAIIRINGAFSFSDTVQATSIAGNVYSIPDNTEVWVIGWGDLCYECQSSEQLRHVQVWTVNQDICRQRYRKIGYTITDNMICSGWLDVGGRDSCQGDSGGPLLHNMVVVGLVSFGEECALPQFPGVNARVSAASEWIVANG